MINVSKAQFAVIALHSWGLGDAVSDTVGPGHSPGGGGGNPTSSEDPAFDITKDIKKVAFHDPLPLLFLLFFIND